MDELNSKNELDNEIDIERIMELDLLARSIAKNYVEKFEVSFGVYFSYSPVWQFVSNCCGIHFSLSILFLYMNLDIISLEN